MLEECLQLNPKTFDFHLYNILLELYMSTGEFEAGLGMMNKLTVSQKEEDLPLDIIVNYGICFAYLGKLREAKVGRVALLAQLINFPSPQGSI